MNPRKPTVLRLLAGTHRPDRDAPAGPSLPATGDIKPPIWLTDVVALAEFHRLARVLAANHLFSEGRIRLLADYCMLGARVSAAWQTGGTVSASLLNVHRRMAADLDLTSMRLPVSANAAANRFSNNVRPRR